MLKKLFIVFLSALISISVFCSCNTANEPDANSQEQTVTATTTTTAVPTTTSNPYAEDFALLAQLTKEDGTGEISLDMEPDEVEAVLKKYNLDYSREYDCFSVGRDWGFIPLQYKQYGQVKLPQSYKGLKNGDSKDSVIEIYGEPDKSYTTSYGMLVFDYYTGSIDDVYQSKIKFTVQMVNDLVTEMFVGIDIPEEELY